MPPNAKKARDDRVEVDLGPPYHKYLVSRTDPWNIVGGKLLVPGSVWGLKERKSYQCIIMYYMAELEWVDSKGLSLGDGPAYVIEDTGNLYVMRPADVAKLLPKSRKPSGYRSDDEVDGDVESEDEDGAGIRVHAPTGRGGHARGGGAGRGAAVGGRGAGAGSFGTAARDARAWAKWAGPITTEVARLHGDKPNNIAPDPNGWRARTVAELTQPWIVHPCTSKFGLKDPHLQGITRQSIKAWRLVDSFNLVYPKALREHAVKHFNLQAKQEAALGRQKLTLNHSEWPETGITLEHYNAYIAIIGVMGLVRLPSIYDYWESSDWHDVRFVRRMMTRSFFCLMRRFEHFNDSSLKVPRGDRAQPRPPGYDPIFNWRPMISGFNEAWTRLMNLSEELTVDEMMILCAMRIALARRQPNKPIRDGFQIYALCDSKGRWIFRMWFDQGDADVELAAPYCFPGATGISIAEYTLHLCVGAGLKGKWCTVYFDQYFTSPSLFMALHALGIYACGTVQTSRRGYPTAQFDALQEAHGSVSVPGASYFLFEAGSTGTDPARLFWQLCACLWFDKNLVKFLSTRDNELTIGYAMKKKGVTDAIDTTQVANY